MTLAKAVENLGTKSSLPQGWRWTRLGEVCDLSKGRTPREEWYSASGVWLVRFRDVTRSGVDWISGFRTFVDINYAGGLKELKSGTVLLTADAHDPKSIGKKVSLISSIPPHASPAYYSGELLGIVPKSSDELIPEWVLYWLQSEEGYHEVQEYVNGVHLNVGRAKDMKIPLPPLAEQEHIARILNEQMVVVEKARAATEERLNAAMALPAAYLRQIFPRLGQELPPGWRWVRLGEVCQDSLEVRNPGKEPEQSFTYVDISSVDTKSKKIVSVRQLLGKDAPSRARKVINANDVIVATTRPNLNAVATIPDSLHNQICSTGFCVLRAGADLNPAYLFLFVQTCEFIQSLSSLVKGALYPAVTDNQAKAQLIPLPLTLTEQKRIAEMLNEQIGAVRNIAQTIQQEFETVNALPAALLRRAFTGGL